MKLLLLIPSLPAFREDFFVSLTNVLSVSNIEPIIIYGELLNSKHKQIESTDGSLKLIKCPSKEIKIFNFRIKTQPNLYRTVKKQKADGVVFLFNPGIISYWRVYLSCLLRKIPIGIWSCGYTRPELSFFKSQFRKNILDFFFKKAKINISYSTLHKEYLEKIGVNSKNIFVAQNTINIECIIENGERFPKNKENTSSVIVLFVGALIKNKHLDIAMIAVDKLISQDYNITFNIIGKGESSEELEKIRDSLTNKDKINLLGPKYGNEIMEYFVNSDVFLLTGSGGLAINEAMAYGLPIISTIGDGTVRDLIDGNGFLLNNVRDVDEVCDKLKLFLNLTNEERDNMRSRSIEIIKEKATLKNMIEQYYSAVYSLLGLQ